MSDRIKGSSKLSLITLSVSYLLFIVLVYMLVGKLLSGLDYAQKIAPALVLFSVLVPLTFLGIIAGKMLQIFAEARRGNSGQRYKAKIVTGFIVLIFLIVLPQTGLTLIFIQKTAKTWLPDETIPTLQESSNQIFESYRKEVVEFQSFCENSYLISDLRTVFTNPEAAWGEISFANPSVKSIQIYRKNKLIHSLGDSRFDYEGSSLPAEGMLARVNMGNETLIRYNRPFSYNGIVYSAVLTASLSNHLINVAGPLSNLHTYYVELDFYKNNIIIYFIMILAIISSFWLFLFRRALPAPFWPSKTPPKVLWRETCPSELSRRKIRILIKLLTASIPCSRQSNGRTKKNTKRPKCSHGPNSLLF